MANTNSNAKPQKTPKLVKDDYGVIVDALNAHIDTARKGTSGQPLSDAQIVQMGRALALKNKCVALRDAEPKKYARKATAGAGK